MPNYSKLHDLISHRVTIEYDTWWANVRPSNTEPYLRLVLEAKTAEELAQRRAEITEILGEPEQ